MAGGPASAVGALTAFSSANLSTESPPERSNICDLPFPPIPDDGSAATDARLHVLALTEEVVALSTARHAVASFHSVAAGIGGAKPSMNV